MAVAGETCYAALVLCVFVFFLPCGEGQHISVCKFYENQTVLSTQPYTVLETEVVLNTGAVSGSGLSTTVSPSDITYVAFHSVIITPNSVDAVLERIVEMYDANASPPKIQLTTAVAHLPTSPAAALDNLTFEETLAPGLQADWTPQLVNSNSVTGRTHYLYQSAAIAPGINSTVQFNAEPAGDKGEDLDAGETSYYAYVSFYETTGGDTFGPLSLPFCLNTAKVYNKSIFYRHGFTALTFFFAMAVGFIIVALAAFLFFCVYRRRKKSTVSPSKYDDTRMKEKGKKIVMDPKAALRKGLNAIKDYSIMGWNESIVLVLSLKDKLHMFREIDNLDVLATMHVDSDLEKEQNDASIQTSMLLLQGLRHNGDISKGVEDKAVGNFNSNLKELDRKLDVEYKKELEVVYTDLSAKNKEKLAELLQKHRQQKQKAVAATKDLPEKEKQELLNLIDQQQDMEENELTFTLALEQNEGAERLRKEFAVRKRMGIKELQQGMVAEVISQGQLNTEQADWLMKEHKKQQEAVHRMYDEEISRQRMVLEEKLARRRALAKASEIQGDDAKESLNMEAAHIIGYLQKARKNSLLTSEQSEEWIDFLKVKALDIKTDLDKASESQEKELHKRLSQTKISKLSELIKKHEGQIQEYVKVSKSQQTDGPVDPISYADGLLKLRSSQRMELANLENQLDEEHARQLDEMREKVSSEAQEKLKEVERETIQKLQAEGMTEKMVATLMKKHEDEKESLRHTQQKNRRNQEDKLKEELARRRREWANRREKEKQEQEDLREHEADVVEKLVNSQVSMSEAERDRIMKEHEKQMVLLENSLTLNKLRQQRSLEERLNQKRAQQMSRLQTQQQTESAKQRKMAENNGEEDDMETHLASLELMKKHAQQRIAVMQGEQLNIDEELEEIRVEMMKERALALKGQEERLGAMITALQMEKAREMTQIEEQQKAINNLKANLMDDLNERGILSTPECERILDVHRQESEALNERLENQRTKQEKMLRSRLEQRMQQRQHQMQSKQEAEMRNLMEAPGNKFGSKVRRVMLRHKHMVEMEKFRNRMDREVTQSLAEVRRQFEVTKLQKIQEQELAFVAGLVRVGCFEQNELLDVLHMLFPGKTEEEIQNLLGVITEGVQKQDDKNPKKLSRQNSTIVDKIYQAQYSNVSLLNRSGSVKTSKKKKLSKKGSRSSMGGYGLGTIAEPEYPQDYGMNGDAVMYNQRTGHRGSVTGYNNPAYNEVDELHYRQNARNSIAGNDLDNRRKASRQFAGDYNSSYDQGVDFVAMGASMPHTEEGPVHTGRLPPLEDQEIPGRKKKKKKGLLKKHRAQQDQDW